MRRTAGAIFIAAGLLAGGLGWMFLPPHGGRLQYAVEVVEPRPISDSKMPDGLAEIEIRRLLWGFWPAAVTVEPTTLIRLTPPQEDEGAPRLAIVQDVREHFSASDCQLGGLPEDGPRWAAGLTSGIGRGRAELGGRTLNVSAALDRLGPLIDDSLWTDAGDPLISELESAGWKAQVGYLIPALSWSERQQVLARLKADPSLLPAPNADILSPGQPPPISDLLRLVLAGGMVCIGLLVLLWRLRETWREELASRPT